MPGPAVCVTTRPGLMKSITSQQRSLPMIDHRKGVTVERYNIIFRRGYKTLLPVLLLLACVLPSHGSNSNHFLPSSASADAVEERMVAMRMEEGRLQQEQQQRQQLIDTLEALLALERSRQILPSSSPPSSPPSLTRAPSKAAAAPAGTLPLQDVHLRVGVVVDPPLLISTIPHQGSEAKQQMVSPRYSGMVMDIIKSHRYSPDTAMALRLRAGRGFHLGAVVWLIMMMW